MNTMHVIQWKYISMIALLASLIVLSHPLVATSQESSDCIALIRRVYQHLTPPVAGATSYMNYTVRAVMRDSTHRKNSTTTVEVVINDKAMHLRTKEIEVYRDHITSYAVLPSSRIIYITDSDMEKNKKGPQELSWLKDTIFSMSQVSECRDVRFTDGHIYRRVTLVPNARARKILNVETISFLVDMKKESIRQVSVRNASPNAIATVDVTFNSIETNYRGSDLDRPITSLFFDGAMHLLPKYRGYKVVDKRLRYKG